MKATRQVYSLCLVIGMTIVGNFRVLGQGSNYAHTASYIDKSIPASTGNEIRELKVGDKVPDIEISSIVNYPTAKAKISDFKGKLLIIDFWGKYCSSCIAALPKIDSLQKVYKDKLQVLTVTQLQNEEELFKVLQRYKKTKDTKLPTVINDTKLAKYFPHQLVSHIVWIDGNGIVKAITGSEYISSNNIRKVLSGNDINWPVKNDIAGYDHKKPLVEFSQKEVVEPPFLYSSAFTGHLEGIAPPNGMVVDSVKKCITVTFYNQSLISFCKIALDYSTNSKECLLNVKEKSRYLKGNDYAAEWAKKNTYCYSITLPMEIDKGKIQEIVQKDIVRWLDILGINVSKAQDMYIITEKDFASNN